MPIGLVHNYVVLVLGNLVVVLWNADGDPHHLQGRHIHGLRIKYSIKTKTFVFFIPMFSPKAYIYIYI